MLPGVESCTSKGTRSEKKKKRKKGFYYSSKKDLDRSRMRNANKEFKFRGPSKLLDFGNVEVADIASVIVGVLQEVEEVLIMDDNKVACASEVNVGPVLAYQNHFVDNICTFRGD
jgi:hypothetical protein